MTPAPDPVAAHVAAARMVSPADLLEAVRVAAFRTSPPEAPPLPWLHTHHAPVLHRLLHGLRQRRLALLAAPTGHGKSFLALAAAVQLQQPAVLVVPAALRSQWHQLARRLAVPHELITHERLSRSPRPLPTPGLVIVDEAHRFRTATTRRYRHLAAALAGRDVLLLTATPVVNRLDDLAALLQLAASDDLLRRDGVPSLHRLLAGGAAHPALSQLVHVPPGVARPSVERTRHQPALDAARASLLDGLGRLAFSSDPAIAGLLRGLAVRALASSIAALDAVLSRCERLLRHAADAAAAGHPLSRAAVLRATRQLDDQLLLWGMLPADDAPADLHPDDLTVIRQLRSECAALAAADLAPVLGIIPAREPTVIFTCWRATAAALIGRLGARTAWVTGAGSGIGAMRMPRESVLAHFRAPTDDPRAPRLLVATDVAAEGLDLRRLHTVIHADLPWTPTRITQREGRARRAGRAEPVRVHLLLPPAPLERELRQLGILRQKREAATGLRSTVRLLPWELALETLSPAAPKPASAEAATGTVGVPVACRVRLGRGASLATPMALCVFVDECGETSWVLVAADAIPIMETRLLNCALRRLAAAARRHNARVHRPSAAVDVRLPGTLQRAITEEFRRRLALRHSADWSLEPATLESRLLAARLRALGRDAVRARAAELLQQLDRALRWCARAPTAGDRQLQQELLAAPDLLARLSQADRLGRFAAPERPPAPALRLVAVCCFVPSRASATFGPCQRPARSSSTSTAR